MSDSQTVAEHARFLSPGYRLPPLVRRPTRVTCFLFAVAWWAPHRVHYDIELAREEGYEDVLVPGLLLNEYVVTALTSWSKDPTNLRRMTIRNLAPAFAGDVLAIGAEVVERNDVGGVIAVTFEFTITKEQDKVVATGKGTVEVRSEPASQGDAGAA